MSLRERRKTETRQAIVRAATALFARPQGYAGTTTREIAEAAGIATGTLFNYAPTKRDVAVMVWQDQLSVAVVEGFAAMSEHETPADALVALWTPVFAVYASDLALGRVFLTSVMFAGDVQADLQRFTDRFIADVAVRLAVWSDNPMTAALNAFGAYYLTLTTLLSGRFPNVDHAAVFFRVMVQEQVAGWTAPS